MECQDCNKKEADSIIFDGKKKQFFLVCGDCIKEDDFICPDDLIKNWSRQYEGDTDGC